MSERKAHSSARPALDSSQLQELVRRSASGDREAFLTLYDETHESLFHLCLKLTRDKSLAEELCQDTYARALQRLDQLHEASGIRAWLATIARNLYLDFVRSPRAKELPATDPETTPEPEAAPSEPWIALAVQKALDSLSPEDRVALILVDLEGHSYAEAAKITKLNEKTFTSRLVRARARFVEIIEKE